MTWEVVIGLETHCAAVHRVEDLLRRAHGVRRRAEHPGGRAGHRAAGTLPVLNRGAVERAIRFGRRSRRDDQPAQRVRAQELLLSDLPKGYQISQYEIPVVQGGSVTITTEAGEKTVRLTRAHLEEDAGKSLHEDFPA
jgi:aspartyl-tRNA(Asn)/glutamyl-tRNA(Gln) amidotransferase subunit B